MNKAQKDLICQLIELELGVAPGSICSLSKKREHCTARVAFIGLIGMIKGFKAADAAEYIKRSQNDLNYIRRNHKAWLEVDPEYTVLFERICNVYKSNLTNLSNVELLETKAQLETDIKKRGLQLIRVLDTLQKRGISTN